MCARRNTLDHVASVARADGRWFSCIGPIVVVQIDEDSHTLQRQIAGVERAIVVLVIELNTGDRTSQ